MGCSARGRCQDVLVAGPSNDAEMDELVEAYWANYMHGSRGSDPNRELDEASFWAWERVDDSIRRRDPRAVRLLSCLANFVADDEEALAYLGAGPLEDLIHWLGVESPDGPIAELVETVNQHPALLVALGSVVKPDGPIDSRIERLLARSGDA